MASRVLSGMEMGRPDGRRGRLVAPALVSSLLVMVIAAVPMASGAMRGAAVGGGDEARTSEAAAASEALPTRIVLLVGDPSEAARYRARFGDGLLGARGEFRVTLAVVATGADEVMLRAMLLGNDAMCPGSACGETAIVDLRMPDASVVAPSAGGGPP
jgi:hypothetical protein